MECVCVPVRTCMCMHVCVWVGGGDDFFMLEVRVQSFSRDRLFLYLHVNML
jgi:hypothetical protein